MNSNFKSYLLELTQSVNCIEVEVIQSLWSGYGRVSRFKLVGSSMKTVVVKFISLDQVKNHPRGWNTNFAHNRKVRSYEVETFWYEQWSQKCSENSRVPQFLGAHSDNHDRWIVLEDLDKNFPARKYELDLSECQLCLKWLANFHAQFLSQSPDGLWEIGTYWNLETRPEELEKIEHIELKAKASVIDRILNESKYQTIVHGDAKLANFCFSENGNQVAAVDFQYVGGGCGMKDVAYLLGSCFTSEECEMYQDDLLNYYFKELELLFDTLAHAFNFEELEWEWRRMYPIAIADFSRFLLGWMPSHQKVNRYHMNITDLVISELI